MHPNNMHRNDHLQAACLVLSAILWLIWAIINQGEDRNLEGPWDNQGWPKNEPH